MEMGNVSSSTSLYRPLDEDALGPEAFKGSFGCAPAAARRREGNRLSMKSSTSLYSHWMRMPWGLRVSEAPSVVRQQLQGNKRVTRCPDEGMES